MNKQQVKGKWLEIKGEIQKNWGKLTNDELEESKGNIKAIAGIIQRKYGLEQEQATSKLQKMESKVGAKFQDAWAGGLNLISDKTGELKDGIRKTLKK